MKRLLVLVAVLVPLMAAPAHADDTLRQGTLLAGAPQPWQRWANGQVPAVPGTVELRLGPCPYPTVEHALGCTWEGGPVYVDAAQLPSRRERRFVLLHELGHQYDLRVLTDADRISIEALQGAHNWPWWDMPAENFADAYAHCAMDSHRARMFLFKRDIVVPLGLQRVCRMLR